MTNKRSILCSMVFSLISAATVAQNQTPLSLQVAIDSSLAHSSQLKISAARLQSAQADLQEAKQGRLPNLSVSGSYLKLGFADVKIKSSNNGGGNSAPPKSPSQAMYGIANLSLPLYTGGRLKYGIESAAYLQKAAELDAEHDREAVINNSINAYINLFKAQETVAIVKAGLSASIARDSTLSRLEQNGLLARNDLLKARLQTSNMEVALLEAESNEQVSMANLNIMLGRPDSSSIQIDPGFAQFSGETRTLADFQSLAVMSRKDVQALSFQKRAATAGIKSAKAEAYPSLALTGGYIAAHIPDVLTITNAANLGIGLQYNLANLWKKNTKLIKAKAMDERIEASRHMVLDAARIQVNKDFQGYLVSLKKVDVYQKAVEQAEENFRITNNKFNNSLATITELLEAEVAQMQTKLNLQSAKADVVMAHKKLLFTTGLNQY